MKWGVSTYSALLLNMVLTLEFFLLTKNLLVLLVGGSCSRSMYAFYVHAMARLLSTSSCYGGKTRMPALLGTLRYWKAS